MEGYLLLAHRAIVVVSKAATDVVDGPQVHGVKKHLSVLRTSYSENAGALMKLAFPIISYGILLVLISPINYRIKE
jgi:hypothetical protein